MIGAASPRRRGQALVEVALLATILVVLVAIPVGGASLATRRVLQLDAARQAVWSATVAGTPARATTQPATVRVVRGSDGAIRADASVDAAPLPPVLRVPGAERLGALPRASVLLHALPPDGGTERHAREAIRRRWLVGVGAPTRALLRLLIGEEPIRIDFDSRPEGAAR